MNVGVFNVVPEVSETVLISFHSSLFCGQCHWDVDKDCVESVVSFG